jgi:RNA 3'-terminal phosphate cyclase-like protein
VLLLLFPYVIDYEASFLRLLEKITNGCRIRINETGTEVQYVPGFISGGSNLKHECPPSRGIGKCDGGAWFCSAE